MTCFETICADAKWLDLTQFLKYFKIWKFLLLYFYPVCYFIFESVFFDVPIEVFNSDKYLE